MRALTERLGALLGEGADGKRPLLLTATQPMPRTGGTPRKAADTANEIQKDPLDGRMSREDAFVAALQKQFAGLEVRGLERTLGTLRAQKSPAEQALLRRSAEIAGLGIAEAMRSVQPGDFVYQLAAAARFVFTLHGAGPDAYAAIVGGGPNGCILHYSALTRQLRNDDLIVMDYAPTLHGYASDVTRTFRLRARSPPSSGSWCRTCTTSSRSWSRW